MSNWQKAFPTRPLKILGLDWSYFKSGLFFLFLGIFMLVGFSHFWKPDFQRDTKIWLDPDYAQNFTLERNICEANFLIIRLCHADVTVTLNDNIIHQQLSARFLDWGSAGYRTYVVYKRGEPQIMALSLSIDHFWQRLMIFILVAALSVAFIIVGFRDLVRHYRQWSVRGHKYAMMPAIIELKKIAFGYYFYVITLANGKTVKRRIRVKRDEQPFFIDPIRQYALGGVPDGQDFAIVLDHQLTRVELSEAEKTELYNAVDVLNTLSKKTMRPAF